MAQQTTLKPNALPGPVYGSFAGKAGILPVYSINAGAELAGVFSDWERVVLRQNDDGTLDYSGFALNRWQIPMMTMANFETLRAAQGTALTSLETNNINARNEAQTYTTAFLESAVNTRHVGTRALDVMLEFRVKVN